MNKHRIPPVGILALPWLTFGMLTGFIIVTLPQLLAPRGVAGGRIAIAVAVILSPMFWNFIFAPLIDVGFKRRTYALLFGILAVAVTALTVLCHAGIGQVEVMMLGAFLSGCMFQSAIGGWVGSLVKKEQDSPLGAWSTIYNICGGGTGILISGSATRDLSPAPAAALIFATFLAPLLVIPWIPVLPPDASRVRASVGRFKRDLLALLRRSDVVVALCLFALPSASFALSNALGSWSGAFHAGPAFVSRISGAGLILGGIAGCALVPFVARRLPLRPLYLAIGCVGAVFTLGLLLLPRVPASFALAFVGETFFSSAAIATGAAVIFEVIGPGNSLAATTYALLIAAMNLPIDYMEFIDARGYEWRGITGAFVTDALISGSACAFLAVVFRRRLLPARRAAGVARE